VPWGSRRVVQGSAEQHPQARLGLLGGALARAVGVFPRGAIAWLGALVGWLLGTVLGVRRAHVEQSMVRAGIRRSAVPALASRMYRSLGTSLVEMLWLAARPEVPASRLASIDEWSSALLAEAHERGRGVVLATAHAGNWELAAAVLAERYPLTVVVKRMSVGWVERFCRGARERRNVGLAVPERALDASRGALARGEIVAMLIDQVPGHTSHSVVTDFLSGRADVDRAPASLAAAMRAPLVVAVARRSGVTGRAGGAHVLEVLGVFEPPARDRRAWAAETTRLATRIFERWVHAHPSEWLWMHRRWRAAPGTSGAPMLPPGVTRPRHEGAPGSPAHQGVP
jgi:KDO2-lipid IV(A) lauroyltransferase